MSLDTTFDFFLATDGGVKIGEGERIDVEEMRSKLITEGIRQKSEVIPQKSESQSERNLERRL